MPKASDSRISPAEFDQIFIAILAGQLGAALDEAAACTQGVFELSSRYVEQPTFEALKEFQSLYFSHNNDAAKGQINAEVDDLFDQLQAQLNAGEELHVDEDVEAKKRRLSLSAVQKKLEGLITLDGGVREQILPAISSMQCEDEIRQRTTHILEVWRSFVQADPGADCLALARSMADTLSSVEEAKSFYQIVLKEEAPKGLSERSVFIEF